jgi:hypothetical protein
MRGMWRAGSPLKASEPIALLLLLRSPRDVPAVATPTPLSRLQEIVRLRDGLEVLPTVPPDRSVAT